MAINPSSNNNWKNSYVPQCGVLKKAEEIRKENDHSLFFNWEGKLNSSEIKDAIKAYNQENPDNRYPVERALDLAKQIDYGTLDLEKLRDVYPGWITKDELQDFSELLGCPINPKTQ
ncbi:MAG: hypothetical protein U0003_04555 [Vampirovibrionales bacterium]